MSKKREPVIDAVTLVGENITVVRGQPVPMGEIEFKRYEDGDANTPVKSIELDEHGNVLVRFVRRQGGKQKRRDWLICNQPCIIAYAEGKLYDKNAPEPAAPTAEQKDERAQLQAATGAAEDTADQIEQPGDELQDAIDANAVESAAAVE